MTHLSEKFFCSLVMLVAAIHFLLAAPVFGQELTPSSRPIFRLGFGDNTPPLYWKAEGSNSSVQGYLVDLTKLIVEKVGFDFQAQAFPLSRLQLLVEKGSLDAMVINVTPRRLEFAVPSVETLLKDRVSVFVRKDSPALQRLKGVKTLDDLALAKVTVNGLLGSGWHKTNLESRGIKIFYSDGTVSTVKMLIKKRGDIVVDMALNINWVLKNLPGGDDILEMPNPISLVGWHLMISKLSPFAKNMELWDHTIRQVKSTPEYHAILKKYFIPE